MSSTKYRKDIQALRGIAVLAVVLFHSKDDFFPLGYLGVDVFFVISGFVVTPLILRIFTKPPEEKINWRFYNLRLFYERRFYRLAPALATTLFTSAALIFLFGPISDHKKFIDQGIATLFLIGNIGAYRHSESYFSPNPNPLIHTWSLSVEEQIYIFLPLIFMLILQFRNDLKKVTVAIFTIITLLSLISFTFPHLLQSIFFNLSIQKPLEFSFYSTFDRIWQFTLGGLLYFIRYRHYLKYKFLKKFNLVLIIAIILILFGPINMDLKASSVLASFLTTLIILFRSLEQLPSFFLKVLIWLGDRSYSVYLVHMPLLYVAKYSSVTKIGANENRAVQTIVAVAASFYFGSLCYSKIENRYRRLASNELTSFNIKSHSFTLIFVFVISVLSFMIMNKGLSNKYFGLDRNISRPVATWDLNPNCHQRAAYKSPCTYSKVGAGGTVLLIGDSHASHIAHAVINAASNINYSSQIWAVPGCHFRFQKNNSNQDSIECSQSNQHLMTWVDKNKPDIIIFSEYVKVNTPLKELQDSLLMIKSVVPKILLIENNPIFIDDPFDRSIFSMILQDSPSKTVSKSNMDYSDKLASHELSAWAKNNQINTLNFDSVFCGKRTCKRFSDQGWLYSDQGHLSVVGAALTISQIENSLRLFTTN